MVFSYGYVDESGQTGLSKKSSKYLILPCIMFQDSFTAGRIAKEIFRKFGLGKQQKNEIHTTHEKDRLRIKFLAEIRKHKYKIVYVAVKKMRLDKDYYKEAFKLLCEKLQNEKLNHLWVASLDRRKSVQKELDQIAKNFGIKMQLTRTFNERGLQIADFVAWCIYQKYECGREEYYNLLMQN